VLLFACGGESPPPAAPAAPAAPAPEVVAAVPSGSASDDAAAPAAASAAKGPFPESTDPALRDPSKAQRAPATFSVAFVTTAGDFRTDCTRSWAPNGVDRFYHLVEIGFFDDVAFFRVVKQPRPFVVQFGIHGNPEISRAWINARVAVDKPKESNLRGTLTFAMSGSPDTRTTQLFINFGANVMLDHMGFAPICKVAGDGMDVVDRIESSYGEEPSGAQGEIQTQGNAMLRTRYPLLDYIKTARLIEPASDAPKK
jgi:peptidyl-prolyl cis-trans isomerase A (cyclophilin A)